MDIIFTSCATESNNAAIAAALRASPDKRHIVTFSVEHCSVLNYCMALEKDGYRVTALPVDRDGRLTPDFWLLISIARHKALVTARQFSAISSQSSASGSCPLPSASCFSVF